MAKKKHHNNNFGRIFFVIGALIAILGGIVFPAGLDFTLSSVLIALGIVVGLMNISVKETSAFLMAVVSLVIMSALGGAVLAQVPTLGVYLEGVMLSILTFVIPAGIIVALKSVYSLAEE